VTISLCAQAVANTASTVEPAVFFVFMKINLREYETIMVPESRKGRRGFAQITAQRKRSAMHRVRNAQSRLEYSLFRDYV
jgi:hypothetical protein